MRWAYKVVKGSSGCPSINTLILHSLVVRKGNIEGTSKARSSGWVLVWKGWYPSPLKWWSSSYTVFLSLNQLKAGAHHTGCRGWERQKNLGYGLSQQTHFQSGLSEFSCGSKDTCSPYSLWLSLPRCESASSPFSGLHIPGLIQWSAARKCGRVSEVAALTSSLPCSSPCALVPQGSFDMGGFVGGSGGGKCLWDIMETSENFLGILLAHYSFLFGVFCLGFYPVTV